MDIERRKSNVEDVHSLHLLVKKQDARADKDLKTLIDHIKLDDEKDKKIIESVESTKKELVALKDIVTAHNVKGEQTDKMLIENIVNVELQHSADTFDLKKAQERTERAIWGDEDLGELGMKAKVDEIHTLLTQARTIRDFFGGFRGPATWIITIAGLIAIIKIFGSTILLWMLPPKI